MKMRQQSTHDGSAENARLQMGRDAPGRRVAGEACNRRTDADRNDAPCGSVADAEVIPLFSEDGSGGVGNWWCVECMYGWLVGIRKCARLYNGRERPTVRWVLRTERRSERCAQPHAHWDDVEMHGEP